VSRRRVFSHRDDLPRSFFYLGGNQQREKLLPLKPEGTLARLRSTRLVSSCLLACLIVPSAAPSQKARISQDSSKTQSGVETAREQGSQRPAEVFQPAYVLGPDDELIIRARDFEEITERPVRIDERGYISLPVLGRLKAAGNSVQALEDLLCERLKEYVKSPQVVVSIARFRPEPIFLVGAVRSPGVHNLQGRRTLLEMLAETGGLLPSASRRIKITRRIEAGPLPLPNAEQDQSGRLTSAEINLDGLIGGPGPAFDIELKPYDVITARAAGSMYIIGEVVKAGPLEFNESSFIPAIQAISIAGGFTPEALPEKAVVLRLDAQSEKRTLIAVDLRRIMAAQEDDFRLLPNDVLVVPRSKRFGVRRTLLTMIPGVSTSLLVSLLTR